jgi:hypothetical protein
MQNRNQRFLGVAIATLILGILVYKLENSVAIAQPSGCQSTLTPEIRQSILSDLRAQGIVTDEVYNLGLQGNYGLGALVTSGSLDHPEVIEKILLRRESGIWQGYILPFADYQQASFNGTMTDFLASQGIPRTTAECIFQLHEEEGV